MKFMDILETSLESVKQYTNPGKYILTPRAFTGDGKWNFNDYIIYILANKGKSTTLEIENFVEKYFNDNDDKSITKQGLSKQRMKIDSLIFKDMNLKFVELFINSEEYNPFYKNYFIFAIDGTKSEIPNTPESREWANINDDSLKYTKPARVVASTIIDVKYGIILDSIIGKADSNERVMMKQHIETLKNIIDFKKTILLLDRGYYSLELKLFLEKYGINYVFRLPRITYEKEINNMKNSDENLKISNTSERRRSITDENLLKKAEKLLWIEARVIKIPIINSNNEEDELILLTNLHQNEFNTYEIAGLYAERWEIEVNYDRLKNKIEIENYTGKSELIINQDFYSSIYLFNLSMILKNNIQKHLERKNEEKEYRTNFNVLIGRIKNKIIELFTSNNQKIKKILNRIIQKSLKTTYLYDFNRPKKQWKVKLFIGKFRFNQRRNS